MKETIQQQIQKSNNRINNFQTTINLVQDRVIDVMQISHQAKLNCKKITL